MLSTIRRFKSVFAIAAIAMAVSLTTVDFAEARRGGGFGSRGSRTFSAPAVTRTAPKPAAPVDRTMTPRTQQNANTPNASRTQAPQNRGLFGGLAGGLLGGLVLGGLFGMLMGTGFGGAAGILSMLFQVALIAGLGVLLMRMFARRQQQVAGSPSPNGYAFDAQRKQGRSFEIPKIGSGALGGSAASSSQNGRQSSDATDEIGINNDDFDYFEGLLQQVQAAYSAEDYAALRVITTPEAMSYLAEELGENATSGLKNEVSDVTLLQGDLSEAWHEDGKDYATVAMRYSSIDYMLDRNSGSVVQGDPDSTSETIEVWTFVRVPGMQWQLSAIQNAA